MALCKYIRINNDTYYPMHKGSVQSSQCFGYSFFQNVEHSNMKDFNYIFYLISAAIKSHISITFVSQQGTYIQKQKKSFSNIPCSGENRTS